MNLQNIILFWAAATLAGIVPAAAEDAKIERGRYLASIMDCGGCHTPGALAGKPDMTRYLGGGDIGFEIPELGVFYPPNLTPAPEAEISQWTDGEIVAAVRTGVRPDGRELVGIMPWHAYAVLTDEDAGALVAYLRELPPIASPSIPLTGAGEKPPAPYMKVVAP